MIFFLLIFFSKRVLCIFLVFPRGVGMPLDERATRAVWVGVFFFIFGTTLSNEAIHTGALNTKKKKNFELKLKVLSGGHKQ